MGFFFTFLLIFFADCKNVFTFAFRLYVKTTKLTFLDLMI